jgi:hypothetical protein
MEPAGPNSDVAKKGLPGWGWAAIGVLSGLLIASVIGLLTLGHEGSSTNVSSPSLTLETATSTSSTSSTSLATIVEPTVPTPESSAIQTSDARPFAIDDAPQNVEPFQASPPPTMPPATAPPTTVCVPDSGEIARIKNAYDRAQLNYRNNRALAIYEGRYNDARTMDLDYQANSAEYQRANNAAYQCQSTYWEFTIVE